MVNNRSTGTYYEDKAADYLTSKNVDLIERNYRCRMGEVDLIGRDTEDGQNCLVFFEVKYRTTGECGSAAEAVGRAKQKKICHVCDFYRMMRGVSDDMQIRFDVVAIDGEEITWIRNAFQYTR